MKNCLYLNTQMGNKLTFEIVYFAPTLAPPPFFYFLSFLSFLFVLFSTISIINLIHILSIIN